jgi:hypothetical protein
MAHPASEASASLSWHKCVIFASYVVMSPVGATPVVPAPDKRQAYCKGNRSRLVCFRSRALYRDISQTWYWPLFHQRVKGQRSTVYTCICTARSVRWYSRTRSVYHKCRCGQRT